MTLLLNSRLYVLTGLFGLFAFSGDIVADSLSDLRGDHCVSQSSSSDSDSQHEKNPCSHCSCAVHNGSVVATTSMMDVTGAREGRVFLLTTVQAAPPGVPAGIDHPPQLA